MDNTRQGRQLVLSIAVVSRGFGYAVFNGGDQPIDWGFKETKDITNYQSIRKVGKLISYYEPDMVVLEDTKESRKGIRAKWLIGASADVAKDRGATVARYTRSDVRYVFAQFGPGTKFGIAKSIGTWLPQLAPLRPPYRMPWTSETSRMAIFDAAALALTYFYHND